VLDREDVPPELIVGSTHHLAIDENGGHRVHSIAHQQDLEDKVGVLRVEARKRKEILNKEITDLCLIELLLRDGELA